MYAYSETICYYFHICKSICNGGKKIFFKLNVQLLHHLMTCTAENFTKETQSRIQKIHPEILVKSQYATLISGFSTVTDVCDLCCLLGQITDASLSQDPIQIFF